MPQPYNLISGREVVDSGIVLATKADSVTINTSGEVDFSFVFKVNIVEKTEDEVTEVAVDEDGEATISMNRKWRGGSAAANIGEILLASDSNYNYYLNFMMDMVGGESSYAYQMVYNILRENNGDQ